MTVLVVALLLEFLLSEPPLAVHPVVWMGRYLGWAGKRLPSEPEAAFLGGAIAWCAGATVCVLLGVVLSRGAWHLGWWAGALVEGALLWPLFSIRMLFSEVKSVEDGLAVSLEEGRARLARIVSRDVSTLDAAQVRESALESLSENLSDSVIAPLFWWALLGLPGAFLYRFANTADASWGYRGEWEHKGKWAARADDLLNWAPARLTAMLMGGFRRWNELRVEAGRTPSPNGGWPMGALALALGVRLGKPGVYVLNEAGESPASKHVVQALGICATAVFYGCILTAVLRGLITTARW